MRLSVLLNDPYMSKKRWKPYLRRGVYPNRKDGVGKTDQPAPEIAEGVRTIIAGSLVFSLLR
jgi:hypothetical protein